MMLLGLRKGSRRDHLLRDVKNQVVLIAIRGLLRSRGSPQRFSQRIGVNHD